MKKLLTTLLSLSLLTTSLPAHSTGSAVTWAKKNMYALLGASIAIGIAYLLYKKAPQSSPSIFLTGGQRTQKFSLGPNPKITIANYFPGTIRIIGHDQENTHIEYEYQNVPTNPITQDFNREQAALTLTAGNPAERKACNKDAHVNLVVHVPKASNIEITHPLSDAFVDDIDGEIFTSSKSSGTVIIRNARGKIRAIAHHGLAEIHGGKDVYAESQEKVAIFGAQEKVVARSINAPMHLEDCENINASTKGPITINRPRGGIVTPIGCGPLVVDGKARHGFASY